MSKKMIALAATAVVGISIGVFLLNRPQGDAQKGAKRLSEEEVVQIAKTHANDTSLTLEKIVLDDDDNDDDVDHYDVDMLSGDVEHDFEIDASSGKVLKYEKKDRKAQQSQPSQQTQTNTSQPASGMITEEEAVNIAKQHANVADASVKYVKFDNDDADDNDDNDDNDDRPHYDIDLIAGDTEYDFEVDAVNGKIMKFEKKKRRTNTQQPQQGAAQLTREQAMEAARQASGQQNLEFVSVKLDDDDDDNLHYDIDAYVGNQEYDFEVDAYTGEVTEVERDDDDDDNDDRSSQQSTPNTNNSDDDDDNDD